MDKKNQEQARKKAVALQYKMDYVAPKVVARGSGHMAQRIIDTAKDADVALYENPDLVEELSRVDLGDEIPPELYEIVAQILVFVDDLDKLEAMRLGK
jgi:flagellar biosynthesis protein